MDKTGPYFKDKMKKKEIERRSDVLNEEETEEFLKVVEENENIPSYPKSSEEALQRARKVAEEKEGSRNRYWDPLFIRDNMVAKLRREQRYENNCSDPIVCKTEGWYFYDLYFITLNGPFETELEARFGFNYYKEIISKI